MQTYLEGEFFACGVGVVFNLWGFHFTLRGSWRSLGERSIWRSSLRKKTRTNCGMRCGQLAARRWSAWESEISDISTCFHCARYSQVIARIHEVGRRSLWTGVRLGHLQHCGCEGGQDDPKALMIFQCFHSHVRTSTWAPWRIRAWTFSTLHWRWHVKTQQQMMIMSASREWLAMSTSTTGPCVVTSIVAQNEALWFESLN